MWASWHSAPGSCPRLSLVPTVGKTLALSLGELLAVEVWGDRRYWRWGRPRWLLKYTSREAGCGQGLTPNHSFLH